MWYFYPGIKIQICSYLTSHNKILLILTMRRFFIFLAIFYSFQTFAQKPAPFLWESANLYFLLTDRFYNGNTSNDLNFDRTAEPAVLRGFMGGDLKGITKKIKAGYFDDLGVNAIWFTPVVEQIHGFTDEGTGKSFGFHGYWTKDWTALDPNFGTGAELAELVKMAHKHGIRIVFDVVINHTGPVTEVDPVWPEEWVRTTPQCEFTNYKNNTTCALVKNLPDIRTESTMEVGLPPALEEKWRQEGRLEKEKAELDAFFQRTGYPRLPHFYIIKWLTDYIRKFGIDGYRCDTAKHLEEDVWAKLREEADKAFAEYKKQNPKGVIDPNAPFYLVGEVYNYGISSGRLFDFGDKKVDYFDHGFNSLINFDLKSQHSKTYETVFSQYNKILQNQLSGYGVLNYISSHDDGGPYDKLRKAPFQSANMLMLCPGTAQIYYGDESARVLEVPGAEGDANLRSFMNWEQIENNAEQNGYKIQSVLSHWQKLGKFRKAHPAIGAGVHRMLTQQPYVFIRELQRGSLRDNVIVGLGFAPGGHIIKVSDLYLDGTTLRDAYSNLTYKVIKGTVTVMVAEGGDKGVVLLEQAK